MKYVFKIFIVMAVFTCLFHSYDLSAAEKKQSSKKAKAAAQKQTVNKAKAAVVNGSPLYKEDYDNTISQIEKRLSMQGNEVDKTKLAELKKQVLENMIDTELLYQESKKEKIKIDEEKFTAQWSEIKEKMEKDKNFKDTLKKMNVTESELKERIRNKMLIQQLIDDKFVQKTKISDDEIKTFYEGNKESFKSPEQVQASHILIKIEDPADEKKKQEARKKIEDIQKQIKAGGDFAELAKKYSQCPSNAKGGDLGLFSRGKMVKPFEDAAFALKKGEVSDIVETSFGYHIIKVTDKKAESMMSLEKVKPQIENYLKQQKVRKDLISFLDSLKSKAKIERYIQ
jgi:peptidyl-prolyl cis-trans isomerase C